MSANTRLSAWLSISIPVVYTLVCLTALHAYFGVTPKEVAASLNIIPQQTLAFYHPNVIR